MNCISKIALGTVQFGLDYGINNSKGKINEKEAFKILSYANSQGINALDTAYNYGSSEQVIGNFIRQTGASFNLISKVPKIDIGQSIDQYLTKSLKNLNSNKLYAYLFHDFSSYKSNPRLLEKLKELKKSKKIQKVGFSLYYPYELEFLLNNNIDFDIVQVPYSFLDQRFEKYFEKLQLLEKEIHIRSVFLQGLVFKDPDKLESRFMSIKGKLTKLRNISDNTQISISGLCLNFAVLNKYINKVVIGVDSLSNLEENIDDLSEANKVSKYYDELKALREENEQIILPINWKKE